MVKANPIPQPTKPLQLNQHFSARALLGQIREDFGKIPGLAVFGLKYPSLLKFDEQRHEKRVRANLKSLYGVPQAPCDTQLQTVLDGVSQTELRAPFIHIHQPRINPWAFSLDFRHAGADCQRPLSDSDLHLLAVDPVRCKDSDHFGTRGRTRRNQRLYEYAALTRLE